MSLAKRDGKSGTVYSRSPRQRRKYGPRDNGTGEERREGERREGERREGERREGERREGERREGERREGERREGERRGRDGERKERGLSGQMSRNREVSLFYSKNIIDVLILRLPL